MTRQFSSKDFMAYRVLLNNENIKVLCKPAILTNLKSIINNVRSGYSHEFIYIVPLSCVKQLVSVEVEEKYSSYTYQNFLKCPIRCGVKVYKGDSGKIIFS